MTDARATDAEKAAVDAVAGPPPSSWAGGERAPADYHVADGGYHLAAAQRHLLLPALRSLQSAVGWVSPGGLNYLSERLTVPPAEAFGVASFYSLIATDERPGRVIHVCDDIACAQAGAGDLIAGVEAATASDPTVLVERSPCLGQCDRAPAALLQIAGVGEAAVAPADAALPALAAASDDPGRVRAVHVGGSATRRLLRRVGEIDPFSLDGYRRSGGYEGLARAIEIGPEAILNEVKASRILGRGGAAFPMGVKWEAVANSRPGARYLICNADESEPGTFKDRVLLEEDPFTIVEAMTIGGIAVGAGIGYLYIRGEYPLGARRFAAAVAAARSEGLLGADVMGSGHGFEIEIRQGAGAYICGEETALFNSIEGYRGEPRNKPPFPTQAGLFRRPTVVNNVETLANIPAIVAGGGAAFAEIGTAGSTGPKLFCLSGAVANPGVYEVEFGATLGELIDLAGGTPGDVPAILLGGAAGSFVRPDMYDLPLTFEDTREAGVSLGSGVIMPFSRGTDFDAVVSRIAAFFRDESCGQCVPCRVGTVRQEEALHRLTSGRPLSSSSDEVALLGDIDRVMRDASICGLGQTAGSAVQSALRLGLIGGAR
jgi:NADH-quinone oxidoreductase subunit F